MCTEAMLKFGMRELDMQENSKNGSEDRGMLAGWSSML